MPRAIDFDEMTKNSVLSSFIHQVFVSVLRTGGIAQIMYVLQFWNCLFRECYNLFQDCKDHWSSVICDVRNIAGRSDLQRRIHLGPMMKYRKRCCFISY